jgi:hypothetical protein
MSSSAFQIVLYVIIFCAMCLSTTDFGPRRFVLPTSYTVRHGGSSAGNVMRNWRLQVCAGSDSDNYLVVCASHADSFCAG